MKQLRKWTVAAFCSLAGVLYAQTPSYSTYQVNKDLTNFTDWTASSLSKNFKDKHLKGMESQLMKQLAEKMLRGDYNSAVGKFPGMQSKSIRKTKLGSIVLSGGNQLGITIHTEALANVSFK